MKHMFKRMLALVLALVMLCLVGCTPQQDSQPATTTTPAPTEDYSDIPAGYNQLVIYWDRSTGLDKTAFWIWPENGDGQGYPVEADAYGCKVVVNIPENVSRVGFIACYDCTSTSGNSWIGGTKDVDSDRFIDMTSRRVTAYLKSGDANIYYSNDGGSSLDTVKEIKMAGMTSMNTIKYNINPKTRITSLDQIKVYENGRKIEVTGLSSLNNEVIVGELTLAETLDLSKVYTIEIEGYGQANVIPTTVFDTKEFVDNYTYDGDDLGAVIHGDQTTFKVWAPTASKVVLNLFTDGHTASKIESVDMVKGERGVWAYTANYGSGTYYTYTVTTAVGTQETTDPYAKAAGLNGNRSMVIDLDTTDPEGWENDQLYKLDSYTDAVIWEVHVRDFSNTISNSQYKGKYLAFTEKGLVNEHGIPVGIDYLKELGITHVHLLPVYDYATVDEANPNSAFNWGYDPKNYNVPEGSYSTDPYNGAVRINEYKQMVQALHEAGIGVIMDMVYNHTYEANASFNKIVPYYYYRYDSAGKNTNASGCGNDTASERYMYGKFMVDSVSYWAEEYHLDGFRFDLMGLHDLQTMDNVEKAVHEINPSAIIYGEGWTMGSTVNGSAQANQSQISKIEALDGAAGSVAVFNDAIRDGLKGSVFDEKSKGYISGAYAENAAKVQFGIAGGMGAGVGWKVTGAAVINYMSAHDNNTLWDKLAMSNGTDSVEARLAMNRLGAAIMMISKGTPFWQAGEEMLRTKVKEDGTFDENSYKSSDAINNIKWDALKQGSNEYEMMLYYKGLIEMRKAYDIFRGREDVTLSFGTLAGGGMTVTYTAANGEQAIVVINPTKTADTYTLSGEWKLVANGTQAGANAIDTMSGTVTVAACSILVFVK